MTDTPRTLIFDVNETLLDLTPLKETVGEALGGRSDLLPLWFTTMLQYSLVDSITGNYRDFAHVGVGALMMIGEGFEVVALTNSSREGVTAQLTNAGIIDLFDHVLSTEEVQAFKPDPRPYRHALDVVGARPRDALMVAAHAWDLAGAREVGLRTAFIARPGATLYPNVERPDHVVADLSELVATLTDPKASSA